MENESSGLLPNIECSVVGPNQDEPTAGKRPAGALYKPRGWRYVFECGSVQLHPASENPCYAGMSGDGSSFIPVVKGISYYYY